MKVICDSVRDDCTGCFHSKNHDPKEEDGMCDQVEALCCLHEIDVKCVEVNNEIT